MCFDYVTIMSKQEQFNYGFLTIVILISARAENGYSASTYIYTIHKDFKFCIGKAKMRLKIFILKKGLS